MVRTILDEINHQERVTESMTTSPAFSFLWNMRITLIHEADPASCSCGIPFLHMQHKARQPRDLLAWDRSTWSMESAFIASQRRRPGYSPSITGIRFCLLYIRRLRRSIILLDGKSNVRHRCGVLLRYLAWSHEAYNCSWGYPKPLDAVYTGEMCIWYILNKFQILSRNPSPSFPHARPIPVSGTTMTAFGKHPFHNTTQISALPILASITRTRDPARRRISTRPVPVYSAPCPKIPHPEHRPAQASRADPVTDAYIARVSGLRTKVQVGRASVDGRTAPIFFRARIRSLPPGTEMQKQDVDRRAPPTTPSLHDREVMDRYEY